MIGFTLLTVIDLRNLLGNLCKHYVAYSFRTKFALYDCIGKYFMTDAAQNENNIATIVAEPS